MNKQKMKGMLTATLFAAFMLQPSEMFATPIGVEQPSSSNAMFQESEEQKMSCYLFAYFTGNRQDEEQICFALSEDGYNYTLLNDGNPIISSDTISRKKAVRDPHILRGEDGKTFYMVVTDMRSGDGWSSNDGLVLMKSTDLINWTHSAIDFPETWPEIFDREKLTQVWAPQTIYDAKAKKYMVYYSIGWNGDTQKEARESKTKKDDTKTHYVIYYSYANEDFTELSEPKVLYDHGANTIDADIVFNEADGLYHMFFKTEGEGNGIQQATAKKLRGKWTPERRYLQQTNVAVEGSGVFKLIDSDEWILMYDCYGSGYYQFCKSKDLKNFTRICETKTRGAFTPRHGTTITITAEEAARLKTRWPNTVARNPVIPGFHADPEVLYSQQTGKYYIYPTTDGHPGWGGYKFNVFSSTDLENWTDEGTILDLKTDQVKWANGNAWAPCIEEKKMDGKYKYFFYFSGNSIDNKGKQIGVAVADSPTGPFVDLGHPMITTSPVGHGQQIDGDVFTDPVSGKSYFYWGNGYMAGAELNADMTSIDTTSIKVLTPQGGSLRDYAYREAPYVFYRNGIYYFMWSVDDTGSPNYHVAYGTSTSPLGPIEVAKNPVVTMQHYRREIYGPAHNSVLQIPGQDEWYIVYHRINKDYINREQGPGVHREVCIDRLTFNPDGTIQPVVPTHRGVKLGE